MGIALPKWIVEGKNNIWVLGLYGIIFGAALPGLVVRPKNCGTRLIFTQAQPLYREGGGLVTSKRLRTE